VNESSVTGDAKNIKEGHDNGHVFVRKRTDVSAGPGMVSKRDFIRLCSANPKGSGNVVLFCATCTFVQVR